MTALEPHGKKKLFLNVSSYKYKSQFNIFMPNLFTKSLSCISDTSFIFKNNCPGGKNCLNYPTIVYLQKQVRKLSYTISQIMNFVDKGKIEEKNLDSDNEKSIDCKHKINESLNNDKKESNELCNSFRSSWKKRLLSEYKNRDRFHSYLDDKLASFKYRSCSSEPSPKGSNGNSERLKLKNGKEIIFNMENKGKIELKYKKIPIPKVKDIKVEEINNSENKGGGKDNSNKFMENNNQNNCNINGNIMLKNYGDNEKKNERYNNEKENDRNLSNKKNKIDIIKKYNNNDNLMNTCFINKIKSIGGINNLMNLNTFELNKCKTIRKKTIEETIFENKINSCDYNKNQLSLSFNKGNTYISQNKNTLKNNILNEYKNLNSISKLSSNKKSLISENKERNKNAIKIINPIRLFNVGEKKDAK